MWETQNEKEGKKFGKSGIEWASFSFILLQFIISIACVWYVVCRASKKSPNQTSTAKSNAKRVRDLITMYFTGKIYLFFKTRWKFVLFFDTAYWCASDAFNGIKKFKFLFEHIMKTLFSSIFHFWNCLSRVRVHIYDSMKQNSNLITSA